MGMSTSLNVVQIYNYQGDKPSADILEHLIHKLFAS